MAGSKQAAPSICWEQETCPPSLYRRRWQMKTYVGEKQLRMVGKAWEIRATLRSWSKKDLTLQEYLARRSKPGRH
ncbi:Z-ring formation inhibitor MciZ [Brevibacillus ruminantium]|uniref:Z-ring formation inhibitor MciZ n=1 Tax=Brevibacillus ruminantium TaxID=2950604 RepID=UPI002AC80CA0|nr:Z-ring formation inhibitor MciZ [Brevibacillus ruminantium]